LVVHGGGVAEGDVVDVLGGEGEIE